jgi:hypothetical protein
VSVTITGVPETITHQQLSDWVAILGVEPASCRSIRADVHGIVAEVYALDGDGRRYVGEDGDVAMHTISIPVERATS